MASAQGSRNPDRTGGSAIGVDVGGTKIAAGVVAPDGTIVARTRRQTPAQDPEAIESAVAEAVAELRAEHEVHAVGVAAAGYIDATCSTVLFAPNLAWRDEPLREELEARTGLPVHVENDANAAAWGEFRFGTARDVDDMVLLTVGTGLGGGVVVDGNLLRGAHGVAAELGHVRVVPDGLRCGCGSKGCWEQYASGSALVREARALARSGALPGARLLELAGGDPDAITGPQVTQAAQEGDPAGQELLADLGRWLGEGAASVVAVLDPALVVVGGGVAHAGDLLLEPMRSAFRRHLTARGYRPEARIAPASLGNDAGMVGAADLAARRHDG
ncbi:ROK family glucokinase [Thalassiella azotivora]